MCESNLRYTYRCRNCLAIFVVNKSDGVGSQVTCGICDTSRVEWMGRIGQDARIKQDKLQCVCDNRCVWASGPNCDCQCGGANHQSGQAGYTVVTVDCGKARLTCTDAKTVEKHLKIAADFAAAVEAANARRASLPVHTAEGSLVRYYGDCAMRKALKGKSQHDRLKKLASCFTMAA